MNRGALHDALVGLCQQVGSTTEATYESPHDAVDSILDKPNEEPVPCRAARFRCRPRSVSMPVTKPS
jgi:hypothetical protein